MPLTSFSIDSGLDISLFWVMVDSSSLGKVETMIFGLEGRNHSVADSRSPLRLFYKIDTIPAQTIPLYTLLF